MVTEYIPKRGDIVWLQFKPQIGREQSGKRPALVLSHESYNKVVGLGIFCPITSKIKGYPFEVALPNSIEIKGVILSDQVKIFDWRERNAEFICKVDIAIVNKVVSLINKMIN
jgi:mRNA interferase MazF